MEVVLAGDRTLDLRRCEGPLRISRRAGQLKKKGQWQADVFWQHNEQYSLDPNLIDNDIFDARLNMEGVGLKPGYMLTDAVWFNLTYVYAWRIDDTLRTGGANDIAINPLDHYQILQADLNAKFYPNGGIRYHCGRATPQRMVVLSAVEGPLLLA
jgi:hypothetical protein